MRKAGFRWAVLATGLTLTACTGTVPGQALVTSRAVTVSTAPGQIRPPEEPESALSVDPSKAPATTGAQTTAAQSTASQTAAAPGATAAEPPPDPVFTSIDLPSELKPSAPQLTTADLLSGTAELPVIISGVWTDPAGSAALMTWTSPTGSEWTQHPVPGIPGVVVSSYAAASDQLTVITGLTFESGGLHTYVVSSTDRVSWTPIALPGTNGLDRVGPLAVSGSTIYLISTRLNEPSDDSPDVDTMWVIRDGRPTSYPLPPVAVGTDRGLSAMAVHNQEIVISGAVGPEGETNPLSTIKSSDDGLTWSDPATVAGPGNSFAGIVWTGTYYAASGVQRAALHDPSRSGAWTSADGLTWAADPISTDGTSFNYTSEAIWMSRPVVSQGQVFAMQISNSSLLKYVYQRQPDGHWSAAEKTVQQVRPGQDAELAFSSPTSSEPLVMVDHPSAVELILPGTGIPSQQFGLMTSLPSLSIGTEPAPALFAPEGTSSASTSQDPADDPPIELVAATTNYQIGENNYWSIAPSSSPYTWTPSSGVQIATWDPAELATKNSYARGVDPDTGAEVVVARGWNDDHSRYFLSGYYRDSKNEQWQSTSGFLPTNNQGGHGEFVKSIFTLNGLWYAYGGLDGGSDDYAIIWNSANGIDWVRVVEAKATAASSWLANVCLLPNGSPMFVGARSDAAGTDHPMSWTEQDGTWMEGGLPAGSAPGVFNSCSSADGVTTIAGHLDKTAFFSTDDGLIFAETPLDLGPGQLFYSAAVQGGYFGIGFLTGEISGFAIWLSQDGQQGRWVRVPTAVPYGSVWWSVQGDTVLLMIDDAFGTHLWQVTGLVESLQ